MPTGAPSRRLARLGSTAIAQLGLRVNAGHGPPTERRPIAAIPGMEELNIGHTIVARSVAVGLQQAVRDEGLGSESPRSFSDRRPDDHLTSLQPATPYRGGAVGGSAAGRQRNYAETGKPLTSGW